MGKVGQERFTVGVFWKLCEQFGPSIVSLILAIVLARLLSADDYGVIAIATTFILFCDILVQNGFCTSLIRNKNSTKLDYSVAMTLSMSLAVVLYVVIFFVSPIIASYYEMESLTDILRALGGLVFLNGIGAVMNAYITVQFRFKLMFVVHMISAVASGIIGVALAYRGYGAWALVAQKLVQQFIFVVILAITLKWSFKPRFNKKSAKSILGYGMKILGGSLVAFIGDNTYSIVIGKKYSGADLGYLNKADQIPNMLILTASNSLAGVLLPTVSVMQDDKTSVQLALRRVMRVVSYVIFPVVVGLFVVADTLIQTLFTDRFMGSVPLVRALCLFYITVPMLLVCGSVIKALGKSRVYMWSEIAKMVITVSLVIILTSLVRIDLTWLVMLKGVISVLMCLLTLIFTKKYVDYGVLKHILDVLPAALLSFAMGASVWRLTFALQGLPIIVILLIQCIFGVAVYIGLSILFRVKSFKVVFDIALNLVKILVGTVRTAFGKHTKNAESSKETDKTLVENSPANIEIDENLFDDFAEDEEKTEQAQSFSSAGDQTKADSDIKQ